jgi:glucose-1-phosphate cytidylyltransferase
VKPTQSFHVVRTKPDGRVVSIEDATGSGMRINGGYFVFKQEIFDYMRPGEELVLQPFDRLMEDDELYAYPYEGFWACMDTFKEKQMLNDMYRNGDAPWAVWENGDRVKHSVESKTARPNGHEGVHA